MSLTKTILVVSPDTELTEWLWDDLGASREGDPARGHALFAGTEVRLVVFPGPGHPPPEADVMLGLVRHLDVLTLQRMDEWLTGAAEGQALPSALWVCRDENESDFKMSCPYCGQKLWVRDADVDKRGRCPHCRKGFTLPEQEDHVRRSLRLPEAVPVCRIVRNDPGSLASPMRKALSLKRESVLDHLEVRPQAASHQTMNVDVEENGG